MALEPTWGICGRFGAWPFAAGGGKLLVAEFIVEEDRCLFAAGSLPLLAGPNVAVAVVASCGA
jgi:hypothetical protein